MIITHNRPYNGCNRKQVETRVPKVKLERTHMSNEGLSLLRTGMLFIAALVLRMPRVVLLCVLAQTILAEDSNKGTLLEKQCERRWKNDESLLSMFKRRPAPSGYQKEKDTLLTKLHAIHEAHVKQCSFVQEHSFSALDSANSISDLISNFNEKVKLESISEPNITPKPKSKTSEKPLNEQHFKLDSQGRTLLTTAVLLKNLTLLEPLLKNKEISLVESDSKGRTPLSLAGEVGWIDIIEPCQIHFPLLLTHSDKRGYSALTRAAEYGHSDFLKKVYEKSPHLLSATDSNSYTPVYRAISSFQFNTTKQLYDMDVSLILRDMCILKTLAGIGVCIVTWYLMKRSITNDRVQRGADIIHGAADRVRRQAPNQNRIVRGMAMGVADALNAVNRLITDHINVHDVGREGRMLDAIHKLSHEIGSQFNSNDYFYTTFLPKLGLHPLDFEYCFENSKEIKDKKILYFLDSNTIKGIPLKDYFCGKEACVSSVSKSKDRITVSLSYDSNVDVDIPFTRNRFVKFVSNRVHEIVFHRNGVVDFDKSERLNPLVLLKEDGPFEHSNETYLKEALRSNEKFSFALGLSDNALYKGLDVFHPLLFDRTTLPCGERSFETHDGLDVIMKLHHYCQRIEDEHKQSIKLTEFVGGISRGVEKRDSDNDTNIRLYRKCDIGQLQDVMISVLQGSLPGVMIDDVKNEHQIVLPKLADLVNSCCYQLNQKDTIETKTAANAFVNTFIDENPFLKEEKYNLKTEFLQEMANYITLTYDEE